MGCLLVNTARGAVVDTTALIAALESDHLGGAALDVFETEPLPPGDPLLSCGQVVLTPHCADQTPEGIDLLNAGSVDNVIAFLDGKPQNTVVDVASSTVISPLGDFLRLKEASGVVVRLSLNVGCHVHACVGVPTHRSGHCRDDSATQPDK